VDEAYETDSSGNPVKVCGSDCRDGQTQECRALGECEKVPGQRTCTKGTWGICTGGAKPTEETCNGKDDNCNGIIDDIGGSTNPNETGCACTNQPASKIAEIMARPEICGNGIDDNCNGQIDEGCACTPGETRPCGSKIGICRQGIVACNKDGQWGTECVGGIKPKPEEICYNGLDDNCNGEVDEGCTPAITFQNGKKDLNEEGVVLVNQYVELKERKRLLNEEIDAELAKIEEALYAFAQREELEAIFGSDHVAKIKIEMKEKYPLKGEPSRKALDEIVKNAGKWMEVSDLNPWMLARVIGRGGWPPSLVKKIKEFSTLEESRSITLSKLRERE
jgi:hypothetical protein